MTTTDYAADMRGAENIDDLAALCSRHTDAPLADSAIGADQQNALRALLAATALVPYVKRCRSGNDGFEEQIADLVADLRHLADTLDVDWGDVDARVASNYAAELLGM
ncbi:MAG: hypothetical protein WAX14_23120 [Rhodococcus sp. (in: high G+C Gram-positive bacteria)]|uniref:hypothetical protein n=1 Tax=Rhodococcus sp. TaxID=1831 RepID=UPI003BB6836A